MFDEQRKSQQLDAVKRLRVMQTQKAHLQQARAQRQANEAQQNVQRQQLSYESLLAMYATQKTQGCSVDPFLYEQRMLIQLAAHESLLHLQARHDEAERHSASALTSLLEATSKENVATHAHAQSILRIQREQLAQQSVDIADAQLGSYIRHGL